MGGRGSGGRNKKTAIQHLRDGTYRPDRHGPIPEKLAAKRRFNKSVKQSKGNAAKGPVSVAAKHPIPAPVYFDEYATKEWERVCKILFDLGTLQDVNHATLEGYCAAYSRAVRAELELKDGFEDEVTLFTKTGDEYTVTKKKTAIAVAEKAWGQVKMFAVELGITISPKGSKDKRTELEKFLDEVPGL